MTYSYNGTVDMTVHVDVVPFSKGRARRFDGARRALARRLRIPMVRETLWERTHPETGRSAVAYSHHWTSTSALANASFACECHKNERYSRKRLGKADCE